jgi:signal transduction histidine kinase
MSSTSPPTPWTATRTLQCIKGLPASPAVPNVPAASNPATAWSAACLRDRELVSALEQAVAERTAALEQSNRDLDAFARDLAHEMRTPIGQVEAIAALLLQCNGTQSESDRGKWLQLQLSAAQRMRATVQELLDVARWSLAPMCTGAVDLSALCEALRGQLDTARHRAPIDWHIEPGMVLHGSASHIDLLMRNLLSNAVKYTRHAPSPRIGISLRRCGELQAVIVEDNGAGFDDADAARLFQPFVRLHEQADFEGTGLGLSLVKRIVERHGGCIHAVGRPGHGARFEFMLGAPADQTAQTAQTAHASQPARTQPTAETRAWSQPPAAPFAGGAGFRVAL